jgi:hypothetical protein
VAAIAGGTEIDRIASPLRFDTQAIFSVPLAMRVPPRAISHRYSIVRLSTATTRIAISNSS